MPARKSQLGKELGNVRAALRQLDGALGRLGPALQAQVSANGSSRRRITVTPVRRAAWKLQGQYMGRLRGLRPRQKAQVKKIRATKGIRAAIAAAKRLGRE